MSDAAPRGAITLDRRPAEAITHARALAILARYVAQLFTEPNAEWQKRLANTDAIDEMRSAIEVLGLPQATASATSFPAEQDLLEERNRLFGHTVRSACPPYELEYGRGEVFQQSQTLADLAGFYAAFGYQATGPLAERPDHFVAEWEFLSLLAVKEAAAICAGDTNAAECCRDAQRMFLRDHAALWMPAFCARLRKAEPTPFFAATVNLADGLMTAWCRVLDVSTGPAWLELRPVEDDDSTITCGADSATQQVELGPTLAAALADRS